MRFQLIKYLKSSEIHFRYAVRDTDIPAHLSGAYLIADQSIYPEDNGKLVWKSAAYPTYIHCGIAEDANAQIIAEANHPDYLVAR